MPSVNLLQANRSAGLSQFINEWAVGASSIEVSTSSNGLVLSSLRKLAYVGFSLPVLQFMERNALRAGAQIVRARQAVGLQTTLGEIQTYVGIDLAGAHYNAARADEVTPGHLESYSEAKVTMAKLGVDANKQTLKPILVGLLELDALDQAQQLGISEGASWLADHVMALQSAASKHAPKTPGFAGFVSRHAEHLIGSYPHQEALQGALYDAIQRLESLRDAMQINAQSPLM